MNNHAAQYEIVSIDSVKVKVNYKLEKNKSVPLREMGHFCHLFLHESTNCVGEIPYLSEKFR